MRHNCKTLRLCWVQSAAHTASRSALCFCLADGKPAIPSLFNDISHISEAKYQQISIPLFFPCVWILFLLDTYIFMNFGSINI